MQIKKQTDQAIRILVHLANKQEIMVGKELAELVGVSEKYLPYLMHQLRQAGLVSSSSGVTGGYALAKSAKKITLLNVMAATTDEPSISCYNDDTKDNSSFSLSSALQTNYEIMQKMATCYFGSLTIWDLMDSERFNAFCSGMNHIVSNMEANVQLPESRYND